jgi:hypothetical protein
MRRAPAAAASAGCPLVAWRRDAPPRDRVSVRLHHAVDLAVCGRANRGWGCGRAAVAAACREPEPQDGCHRARGSDTHCASAIHVLLLSFLPQMRYRLVMATPTGEELPRLASPCQCALDTQVRPSLWREALPARRSALGVEREGSPQSGMAGVGSAQHRFMATPGLAPRSRGQSAGNTRARTRCPVEHWRRFDACARLKWH